MAIAADGTGAVALNDINDGTVLYIDPNDPQAAALLQQAGLMLSEDGTVQSIGAAEVNDLDASASAGVPQELLLQNTTEGELVETNTNNETNVSKQETINLPSAPDPNVRSKDIIEESLVSLSGFSAIAVQIPNPKLYMLPKFSVAKFCYHNVYLFFRLNLSLERMARLWKNQNQMPRQSLLQLSPLNKLTFRKPRKV
jgi:hypothetical protein